MGASENITIIRYKRNKVKKGLRKFFSHFFNFVRPLAAQKTPLGVRIFADSVSTPETASRGVYIMYTSGPGENLVFCTIYKGKGTRAQTCLQ